MVKWICFTLDNIITHFICLFHEAVLAVLKHDGSRGDSDSKADDQQEASRHKSAAVGRVEGLVHVALVAVAVVSPQASGGRRDESSGVSASS